jgi:hypothetical protein
MAGWFQMKWSNLIGSLSGQNPAVMQDQLSGTLFFVLL